MATNGDPYVYPGTSVLKNKRGIRTEEELEIFERLKTNQRLEEGLPEITLDFEGYCKIHYHIFQDVYQWAGQPRTIDIGKNGDWFGHHAFVEREMDKRMHHLDIENGLQGLSAEAFAERAAFHICEINAIHPFREGNGRTQQCFLELLSAHAGHQIELSRIQPAAWIEASVEGFHGRYKPMAEVIKGAMIERQQSREVSEPVPADGSVPAIVIAQGRAPETSEMQRAQDRSEQKPDQPVPSRPPQAERQAMRELDLPDYAAEQHGFQVEWRNQQHTRAVLCKDGEQFLAVKSERRGWWFENRNNVAERGDILDFEARQTGKPVDEARVALRPALERELGHLDLQQERERELER